MTSKWFKKIYSLRATIAMSLWLFWLTVQPLLAFAEEGAGEVADLPDGTAAKDWIVTVAENIFIALFIIGAVKAFGKKAWKTMGTLLVMAAITAFVVYRPDDALALLERFSKLVE